MTVSLREIPPSGAPWVAALHRSLLKALLKPALNPAWPLARQRARVNRLGRLQPLPRGVRRVAERQGEWCEPAGPAAPGCVLYLHGGAYCVGSPTSHRALTTRIARVTGRRVFVLDYRLAPEHPWPAALDDALAAYARLPQPVVIAGDSAGGGLALLTAQALRDQRATLPLALWLMSPWVDLAPWLTAPPGEAMLSPAWGEACAAHVLAGRHADVMSPLRGDLRGLPPVLLQFGTDEALHDQGLRLHAALAEAGGSVQTEVYQQRWHVFQLHAGQMRSADDALASATTFLNRAHTHDH